MYGFSINVDGNSVAQMKAIEAQLTSMGVKAKFETKEVGDTFAAMGVKVKESLGGIKSLLIGGFGIGALMEGFEFLKESKKDFDDMQKATADLGQTMLTMGGAVGVTEGELNEMAEAMNKTTVNSKAAIVSAQALMLTFGNVKGKQFEEGMKSAGDYAAKFFKGDLMEASKSLGIALDDPIKGMARLHKTGVSFSDTQKEQIKNLQEAGKLTEAQEIILKEIKRETKDQAEIFAKTDAGQLLMAKKQWEDIHLAVGGLVSKIQVALIPAFTIFINTLKGGIEMIKKLRDWIEGASTSSTLFKIALAGIAAYFIIIGAQAGIAALKTAWLAAENLYAAAGFAAEAAAAGILTIATEGLGAALWALPLTWLVAGIVAIIAVLLICWDKFEGFRKFMGGLWGGIKESIMAIVHAFMNLGTVIDDVFHGRFKKAIEDGKKMITDYGKDLTTGMADAVKKGADAAGKSEFKFSNLLKFGESKKEGGPSEGFGKGGGTGLKDSAINTSNLSGASGGLGQAKVINIKIDTVQKIYGVVSKDLKSKGQDAAEMIIRTANNMQGGQSM